MAPHSVAGKQHFRTFIEGQRLTLLDLLVLFTTCKPPLDALVSSLPPLQPRFYSIASSQLAHPDTLVVAFSVVHYTAEVSTDVRPSSAPVEWSCAMWG